MIHAMPGFYVSVEYDPSVDKKYLPHKMIVGKKYLVIAYENGKVKRNDGSTGDAFFYHFVGDDGKPCRVLNANCILTYEQYYRSH